MPQFVAFMRAINVGGRFVKMAKLAESYSALGYTDVSTFINSGNVLFHTKKRSAAKIEKHVQAEIGALIGFESDVFLRSPSEVAAVAARAAGLQAKSKSLQEVNVAFLAAPLDKDAELALAGFETDVDAFESYGREVYWLCKVKQSDSRFSNAAFERKLRLRTTFRRVSMLQKLAAQLAATSG
ncbi:MAG: DUF1697 domain-containing protein [Planctomycetes bacterium]|nr:DUF1697 domain-containing protein [Planctomycetota bacterium]